MRGQFFSRCVQGHRYSCKRGRGLYHQEHHISGSFLSFWTQFKWNCLKSIFPDHLIFTILNSSSPSLTFTLLFLTEPFNIWKCMYIYCVTVSESSHQFMHNKKGILIFLFLFTVMFLEPRTVPGYHRCSINIYWWKTRKAGKERKRQKNKVPHKKRNHNVSLTMKRKIFT